MEIIGQEALGLRLVQDSKQLGVKNLIMELHSFARFIVAPDKEQAVTFGLMPAHSIPPQRK